ncbi:MAG: hypothetical protein HY757_08920 [Nitrospirae bacterium]|nr:hypothetical protein [Nitrospirota bacterium]
MRRKIILMFLLLAGCIFISSNAFAAWTQAKGHSYNQITTSNYKTTAKFTTLSKDANGDVANTNDDPYVTEEEEFSQTQLSYYGEYGVIDNLTAVFSGGWAYVRSNDILAHTDGSDSVSGVGDILIGLRQKVSDNVGGGPMSIELGIKIPEAYEYENPLEYQNLGDGQYDYTLKSKFGHGFSKGYAVLDIGYKYRDYNRQLDDLYFKPSDQFFVSLSGGYSAASWLSIRGTVGWSKAVGNARVSDDFVTYASCCGINAQTDPAEAILIKDSFGLEQDALTAGLSLAFTVAKNTQLVVSYDFDMCNFLEHVGAGCFNDLSSQNASIGQTWSLALALSL